jgi:FKBP-type peptidyl-prolyl cis-trans isomerase FkpA
MKSLLILSLAFALPAFADEALDIEKAASAEYVQKMAAEAGASVIEKGIVLKPIFTNTDAALPVVSDTLTVLYSLYNREGKLIEEAVDESISFPLNKLIDCWKVGLTHVSVGSVVKLTCPSDTAYGDRGIPPDIAGGAALTFRVTVLKIN